MALLSCPLRGGCRITSPYGPRAGSYHTGVDYAASLNTPVFAPAGGVVLKTYWNLGGGRMLDIRHSDSLVTKYAHLSRVDVRPGQAVTAGQLIAHTGATGTKVTGPHLHFEVWLDGRHVNPATLGTGGPSADSNPGDALLGRPPIGYRNGASAASPGPRATDAAGHEYFPNVVCDVGFIARPSGQISRPRCFPVEQEPGLAGVAEQTAREVAEDMLPVLANVGLVLGAVLIGWGGIKRILEG